MYKGVVKSPEGGKPDTGNPISQGVFCMSKPIETHKIDALRRFYRSNQRMPSYAEMTRILGYQSKNASFRFAKRLVTEGYVKKDTAGKLIPNSDRFGIPLLGYVQAGFPSPAEDCLLDTLSIDSFLIEKPEASFLLKVSGDTMINAGILEDDLVIIERGASAKHGDIVLACVDNEWTLKYMEKRDNRIVLVPANANYPLIYPKIDLQIAGVLRGVVRRY